MRVGLLAAMVSCFVGLTGLSSTFAQTPQAAPPPAEHQSMYVDLARKVIPSVVNISTLSTVQSPFGFTTPEEFFRHFFGGEVPDGRSPDAAPPGQPLQKQAALGSGFVIDKSGIILTNNHVVAGADEIKISFTEKPGESPTDAVVIGRDPELDIALIRVKGTPPVQMVPVEFGDSDQVSIGEYVMAVGNPFGQGHSVTHGIVSQKGRVAPDFPLATYIQTDAPINPGNSGGPLVNMQGKVIGINNAIEARAQGIGFAIPINAVKSVLPELRKKGTVVRGYIGVAVDALTKELAETLKVPADLQAPVVVQVTEGGPAHKAGIEPYDVIVSFNDKRIETPSELVGAVTSAPVGKSVPITVVRKREKKDLSVALTTRPVARPLAQEELPKEPEPQREPAGISTGLRLQTVTREIASELEIPLETKGVLITGVQPGSPAEEAGLEPGDVILEVAGKTVNNAKDFYSVVKEPKDYILRVRRPVPAGEDTFVGAILDLKKE